MKYFQKNFRILLTYTCIIMLGLCVKIYSHSDKIVIDQGPLPSQGSYQQSCQACVFGANVTLPGVTQSLPINTLYCASCLCPECVQAAPAILLDAPANTPINYCTIPGGTAALVPCDCSDYTCIQNSTQPPSNLSPNNPYLQSCYGCNTIQSPNKNVIVACAGCLDNKSSTNLTALGIDATKPVSVINNCDGSLTASSTCTTKKHSSFKDFFDKIADKLKSFSKSVIDYLGSHPPQTSTGIETAYMGISDSAGDAGDASADSVSDSVEAIGETIAETASALL